MDIEEGRRILIWQIRLERTKKRCEHYRTSGNLQTNKLLKQERNKKRIAKFVARREEGKAYEYKFNPHTKGSGAYYEEVSKRAAKNEDVRLPLQKITSIMRKLDNQLAKEKYERKARKEQKGKKGVEAASR